MLRALTVCAMLLGATTAHAADKVFVGYLYGPPRDINYPLYTHICHAFVVADGDGKIRPGRNVPSRTVTGDAHKAGVQVLLSLGGWGWDEQFAQIVSKTASEDRYVRDVLKMVDDFDYDGIDLDWEYPDTREEVAGFERLVRRFREGLDTIGKAKGRHLAMTMAASSNNGTLRWLRTEFLMETMDWINVMTYDYTGDWTDYAGHHSPLHASSKATGAPRSTEATILFLLDERKLPADRIALGIPLYGRGFGVKEPYASTKGVAKPRLPEGNYNKLVELTKQGWTRIWDDETKNPWLLSPDGKAVMGYDDVESVTIKAEFAKSKGLRGVFFWEIAADRLPDGTNPLQDATKQTFFKP